MDNVPLLEGVADIQEADEAAIEHFPAEVVDEIPVQQADPAIAIPPGRVPPSLNILDRVMGRVGRTGSEREVRKVERLGYS